MPEWTRALLGGKKAQQAEKHARAEIQRRLDEDPGAWAYLACRQDAHTCETCLHAAGTLRHVKLNDARLLVMLRGHPDCSSPEGCRCEVTIVGSDE